MSFTRNRFEPPQEPVLTGDPARDVLALLDDRRRVMVALSDWFSRLEDKDAIQLNAASVDGTPIGATTPSTGAFTTVRATSGEVITGGSAISGYRGLHSFYTTGTDTAWLYSYEGGVDWYNFGIQARSYSFQSNNVESMSIDVNTNVIIGDAAIATSATNGFLYIPACAGAPSGTPTAYSGRIPIVYDSTNNKLYAYNGAWKSVTLA